MANARTTSSAKLTVKGQITIPKTVRDAMRLGTGDRVTFRLRDDGVAEMAAGSVDLRDLHGKLRPRKKGVTLAGMDAAIRGGADQR
ncbi:MAG: AbrB/MazE/SpoVT family DNA-binding domain-containing protein [Deltaproteobacteria bacterium]|nr:AbrB/MazE/SpoVT family DNA-binding domain-containing protein [Deltaproteobacteria bacterium]